MAAKDKVFYPKNTLNINGNLIDLSSPKIMGILNVTDDSFYDGGKFLTQKQISRQAEKILEDGADMIDIGGYSSRPGADNISKELETKRVLLGIKSIREVSENTVVSVDTFRSEIAKRAIEAGAGMVNDISGGSLDKKMFQTISHYNVSYILMHMVGTPQNMALNTHYDDMPSDLLNYFIKKLKELTLFGIKDVIIDVGFGFSKTTLQNYQLLSYLEFFRILNIPILVGISRKSMIYKILKINPEDALNGTSVLNSVSLLKGAHILRVHDVKEAKEVINLVSLIHN
ncbi:MAG: dihydropteroate synthase [Cytophagales bacterium]|nr:dihydropteroate synthase [Cytophagales bacterium]